MESQQKGLVQQLRSAQIISMHEVLDEEEDVQTVAVDEMHTTGNPKSDRIRLWEPCVLTVARKIILTHGAGSSTQI